MGSNPYWYDQMRARGICYICKTKMSDDDPRRAHTECLTLESKGLTYKRVREKIQSGEIVVREYACPQQP